MKIAPKLSSIILVLFTWLVLDAQVISQQPQSEAMGRMSGLILDRGDARVSKAKIVVEREGFHREIFSEEDGRYEIELLVGTYTITVTQVGFQPSRNADVQIRSNSLATFNVVMKEIVFDKNLVPLKEVELSMDTEIPKTYIQLKKPKPN
jgi:hypothetical protein